MQHEAVGGAEHRWQELFLPRVQEELPVTLATRHRGGRFGALAPRVLPVVGPEVLKLRGADLLRLHPLAVLHGGSRPLELVLHGGGRPSWTRRWIL